MVAWPGSYVVRVVYALQYICFLDELNGKTSRLNCKIVNIMVGNRNVCVCVVQNILCNKTKSSGVQTGWIKQCSNKKNREETENDQGINSTYSFEANERIYNTVPMYPMLCHTLWGRHIQLTRIVALQAAGMKIISFYKSRAGLQQKSVCTVTMLLCSLSRALCWGFGP